MLNTGFRLENSTLLWSEPFGARILRRVNDEPIKGTGWANDDKVASLARSIVQRNAA